MIRRLLLLAATLTVVIVSARATAPGEFLRELREERAQRARQSQHTEYPKIDAELAEKAASYLAAQGAGAREVPQARDWAGIMTIAGQHSHARETLRDYLASETLTAQQRHQAEMEMMLSAVKLNDGETVSEVLTHMEIAPANAASLGSYFGGTFHHYVFNARGAQAAKEAGFDLKFTAVDGREVDLAKLRGKVVLIDFWATWCGPCIAELPNVKKIYADYHDQGFAVVGIALENAKLLPNDTPEQTAEKMAKAKKVLTDFTAKESMPWPQYYDGKHWKTEVATRYNIGAVPAMFLIDQEGNVVTTNARGDKLEQEVKRLLKL